MLSTKFSAKNVNKPENIFKEDIPTEAVGYEEKTQVGAILECTKVRSKPQSHSVETKEIHYFYMDDFWQAGKKEALSPI